MTTTKAQSLFCDLVFPRHKILITNSIIYRSLAMILKSD